jgi:hypothetical protein
MTWRGIEPGLPRWEDDDYPLQVWCYIRRHDVSADKQLALVRKIKLSVDVTAIVGFLSTWSLKHIGNCMAPSINSYSFTAPVSNSWTENDSSACIFTQLTDSYNLTLTIQSLINQLPVSLVLIHVHQLSITLREVKLNLCSKLNVKIVIEIVFRIRLLPIFEELENESHQYYGKKIYGFQVRWHIYRIARWHW